MTPRCYAAIGDSFTAGSEPGVVPFPDLVAGRLKGWRYLNLAAHGARSVDVVDDQLDGAIAARPALVTVICGANDVVRTTRPDIDGFARNLGRVLARLRAELPGAPVVSATYPAVPEFLGLRERTRERMTTGLSDVNAVIRRLATRHGAVILDLAEHPGRSERSNFAADGLHPSAAGHSHAALALAGCLRRLGIELDPEEAAA